VVVPLVAILLVLSAWPAAITERSFGSAPQIPHKGSVVPSSAAAQLQFALKELEQKRKQQGQ